MKYFFSLILAFLSFHSFSQKEQNDTLFIKYDSYLLTKHKEPIEKYNYYLIRGTENQSNLTFFKEKNIYEFKTKKILCLKNILENSNSYYKGNKIRNERLANYLGKYKLFLKKKKKYIEVSIIQEIE